MAPLHIALSSPCNGRGNEDTGKVEENAMPSTPQLDRHYENPDTWWRYSFMVFLFDTGFLFDTL